MTNEELNNLMSVEIMGIKVGRIPYDVFENGVFITEAIKIVKAKNYSGDMNLAMECADTVEHDEINFIKIISSSGDKFMAYFIQGKNVFSAGGKTRTEALCKAIAKAIK